MVQMVPGAGVEPAGAEGPRDFKDMGEGQRTKDLSNSLPFSRTRSTRSALQSEGYGHLFGHLADEADLHRCPESAVIRRLPVIESSQIHHLSTPGHIVRRPDGVFELDNHIRCFASNQLPA